MMEAILSELNALAFAGKLNSRDLALVMEANQRYTEYLEWLETMPLVVNTNLTLEVDGQRVRFQTIDNMASWLSENLT